MSILKRQSEWFEVWKEAEKSVADRCLYRDAVGRRCKNSAIRSHSIQRAGPLATISENEHVYLFERNGPAFNETVRGFDKISTKKASTFPGFCKDHDSSVFRDLDQGFDPDSLSSRIKLAYLPLALEYSKKLRAIEVFKLLRRKAVAARDKERTRLFDLQIKGMSLGVGDMKLGLARYENAISSGATSGFISTLSQFSNPFPFAFSGAFAPEYDFFGRACFPNSRFGLRWNNVSIFGGNLNGIPIFSLSYFKSKNAHRTEFLEESWHLLPPRDRSAAALHLAMTHVENTYFNVGWLNSLPSSTKDMIRAKITEGVLEEEYSAESLLPKIKLHTASLIKETRFIV